MSSECLDQLSAEGLVQRTFLRLTPERRQNVIAAILEEAGSHGPGQLSIKEVARRADVPVGSLYQYFGDRQTLVRFACALVSRRLAAQLKEFAPMLAQMPLAAGLRIYLVEGIAWSRKEGAFLRLYASAAHSLAFRDGATLSADKGRSPAADPDREVVRPIAQAMRDVVREMLQAASERGELRDGIDVEDACRIVNVLLIACGDAVLLPGLNEYYLLYDQERDPQRMIDAAVDMVANGIVRSDRQRS